MGKLLFILAFSFVLLVPSSQVMGQDVTKALDAFSVRDLQTAKVVFETLDAKGLTIDDLYEYLKDYKRHVEREGVERAKKLRGNKKDGD